MLVLFGGILPHGPGPEVFRVHPGGPFWATREDPCRSIYKDEIEAGEVHEVAARLEFTEKRGTVPPAL